MTYFFFILKVACWYPFSGKSEVHVFQTIANNNLVLLIGWSVWINCVNYTNMIDYFNDIPFLKFEMACWYHIVVKMANLFRQCYLPHVLYYYDLAVSRSLTLYYQTKSFIPKPVISLFFCVRYVEKIHIYVKQGFQRYGNICDTGSSKLICVCLFYVAVVYRITLLLKNYLKLLHI